MLARARVQGDVRLPRGITRALFPGQVYDLPEAIVEATEWLEPVEAKAIHSAPEDKAIHGPQRTKRRGTR